MCFMYKIPLVLTGSTSSDKLMITVGPIPDVMMMNPNKANLSPALHNLLAQVIYI